MLLARVLAFVSVFGFNAVLARCLAPADFGLFALLFSLATLTSLLASCGMNRALVKVLASSDTNSVESIERSINIGVSTSVLAGVVVGAIAFFACGNFLNYENGSPWMVACLFGGIVLFRNIHFVLAETTRGFHETNWSNLFGGPAGGPVPHLIFLLILIGFWQVCSTLVLTTVLGLYLACLVVSLGPLVLKLFSLRKRTIQAAAISTDSVKADAPVFSTKSIWALAIPLMLTQSFGLTLSQADIWMAGAFVLPASIAIYCAAQRMLGFLTIPLQISGTAIVSFIPELVSKKQTKKLQEMLGLATFASGIPGLLIGSILLMFPGAILSIVFGEFYAQAAPILQLLVIGQLICVLTGPCETVLMMAGHQNKTLVVNIVTAIAVFSLGTAAIFTSGIIGLAMAMCVVTMCQNLFNWWLTRKLVGVSTHFDFSYAAPFSSYIHKRFLSKKGSIHVTS